MPMVIRRDRADYWVQVIFFIPVDAGDLDFQLRWIDIEAETKWSPLSRRYFLKCISLKGNEWI